ncbi:MAG TPA: nitrate/sulfonate/bicarbonate ABC transporter ATP-binding protein [Methylovirgula sp.]
MPEPEKIESAAADVELEIRHVRQTYARPSGAPLLVLDDINLTLHTGEIVALLGRSGCGKSTLLRVVSGLAPSVAGEVRYHDRVVDGPAEGIAIVFQSFALFPWLTVLQNVQAGLDARGVPEKAARTRALDAIELIGLDGFENAYPHELSGGMSQRVGFARALVVDPTVLLMDEPFSALDVLTGEILRSDFMDLWTAERLSIKSVLLVTHNIEEAVFMADRILILAPNPGRIAAEIDVPLPRPRQRLSSEFRDLVDDIYGRMTAGPAPTADGKRPALASIGTNLPIMSAVRIVGLADVLASAPFCGKADLQVLAARLHLSANDLFHIAEMNRMMGFAELRDGDLHLTAAGRAIAQADIPERKRLFAEHLLRAIPLAAHIRRVLDERPEHIAPRSRFIAELEDHLSTEDAESTLNAVIGWGRYAECFAYDTLHLRFSLEDSAAAE